MKSCSHIFALITACVFLFCGCSNYLSLSKASSVPYPQTEYDTALKAYRDSLEMPLSPVDAEHGEDAPIVWEDTGMEAAVRLLLNRPEGTISRSDVWNLNTLTITERTMFEGDSGTTTIVTVTAQQGDATLEQEISAVGKESHIGMTATYASHLLPYKEGAFHRFEILQTLQTDPDAVLVIGTDTRHTLVAMVVTYHHGIRHHVCPVSACPVAVHLVHMRHDARISLCPALYGIKIALPVLPAGNAHTLQLRLEVTEHSFFFPRRGSYIIECNQSFHKIKYLNVTHQTQAYTLADIRLRQPL